MQTSIIPLSSTGLLQVSGPDSEKFLQGQLTCDLKQAPTESHIYGAHCTSKGRMIANFLLQRTTSESFLLHLKKDLIDTLSTSLSKYIVFSKATVSDVSNQYRCFGLMGKNAAQWLSDNTQVKLTSAPQTTHLNDSYFVALTHERIECWINTTDEELLQIFESAPQELEALWHHADIEAGIGWVSKNTTEEFLPQMLNLDYAPFNAISFKKGCYTGQEIVARLHYKGQSKRRLYHFRANSNESLSSGDEVFCSEKNKSVGQIVNTVTHNNDTDFLAVINIDAIATGSLYTDENHTQKVEQIQLPYAINT